MTGKRVLLLLICLTVVFAGFTVSARADSDLDAIQSLLHERGGKWKAGETEVSKLSPHEKVLRTGLIKPKLHANEQVTANGAVQAYALSPSLDWRNYGGNFVTPVRNQGNCGSCWAFATTAALESYWLISHNTPNKDVNLSEQVMLSCSGAGSCNGGYIDRASNYARDTGLPPENYYPYTASNGSCGTALSGWQQATDKTQGWRWITTTSVSVDALKNALATYGPLVTTMEVYNDFFYYTSGVYHYTSGSYAGGHAVLLVGYDDAGQYFTVKNSWGLGWGEQGYFRIAYSEINSVVQFGQYTIANNNTAPPAPTCSFSLSPTSASVGTGASAGNVTVNASASTCAWTVTNTNSWITVSPMSGTGGRTVTYSVTQNTGAARSGTVTIAGNTFTITQAAGAAPSCSYTISPASVSLGASAASGSVSITASSSTCTWNATSNANWISVSPAAGNGSGTVTYSVQPNAGVARSGTATIAGRTFTVSQAAAGSGAPTISVSPTSVNFGSIPVGYGVRRYVTISNTGSAPLTVSQSLAGANASSFSGSTNCGTLAPNSSCTTSLIFWATSAGPRSATLAISSNDPAHALTNIPLSGTGY